MNNYCHQHNLPLFFGSGIMSYMMRTQRGPRSHDIMLMTKERWRQRRLGQDSSYHFQSCVSHAEQRSDTHTSGNKSVFVRDTSVNAVSFVTKRDTTSMNVQLPKYSFTVSPHDSPTIIIQSSHTVIIHNHHHKRQKIKNEKVNDFLFLDSHERGILTRTRCWSSVLMNIYFIYS